MRILEEFWYGNIEPTEYDTSSTAYKKLLELICRNEEKLRAKSTRKALKVASIGTDTKKNNRFLGLEQHT